MVGKLPNWIAKPFYVRTGLSGNRPDYWTAEFLLVFAFYFFLQTILKIGLKIEFYWTAVKIGKQFTVINLVSIGKNQLKSY